MKQKELLKLLDNMEEQGEETVEGERILIIDGLNLFFRNFAMMNMVNPDGIHIGGLGGFFRSLGAEIRRVNPTKFMLVFDGAGSSNNRKNLLPEYKSGRDLQRITNWDAFDNLEDEHDAKVDQMVRIIQYLKTLPVKTVSIDKVEADDIIAYLSTVIPKHPKDKVFIVSSDKDFLQLVNENVIVYRPMEKEFYTEETVVEKFKMSPTNFILYKTLMGDNSDKVAGVKGLGPKKLYKLFPELSERDMSLDDIYNICESKFKDHVIYARIIQNIDALEKIIKLWIYQIL
jgi:DNA polymerase-1